MLKLLGVRYVLMPNPAPELGAVRTVEDRRGQEWSLVELSQPNLATYSPIELKVHHSLAATLNFIADEKRDLSKQAVVQQPIEGPFVAVTHLLSRWGMRTFTSWAKALADFCWPFQSSTVIA